MIFVAAGVISDGIYAIAAGALGDRLSTKPRWETGSRYGAGAIYLALGSAAAVSGTGKQ
jgi:threonine/homoserine/homoserine lactone efflux protein